MVSDATGQITESPGPGTRSPGRWRAATRAPSGARSTPPTSGCPSARSSSSASSTTAAWAGSPTSTCSSSSASASRNYFFNQGNIGVSVPLAYPVLLYLLARMLWIGFRGRGAGLRPSLSTGTLGDPRGLPDRVPRRPQRRGLERDRRRLRGRRRRRPRRAQPADLRRQRVPRRTTRPATPTGPANYYAYVPFELALPVVGQLGRPAGRARGDGRVRPDHDRPASSSSGAGSGPGPAGTRLGTILAFAWAACPYTAYALESNSNDILVSALLVGALLLIDSVRRPGGDDRRWRALPSSPRSRSRRCSRLACGPRRRSRRAASAGCWRCRVRRRRRSSRSPSPLTAAALLAGPAVDPGLGDVLASNGRDARRIARSPFSVWGQVPSLGWLRLWSRSRWRAWRSAVAFVPRRRDLRQVAALGAAIMIGGRAHARPLVLPLHPVVLPASCSSRWRSGDGVAQPAPSQAVPDEARA